jgi:hypothetical protein
MINKSIILKCLAPGDLFSARYLTIRALALIVLFLAAHLAGLREYTTFISGTFEKGDPQTCVLLGSIYMLLYFGSVVLAPILLLAALLLKIREKYCASRQVQQTDSK